MYVAVHHQISDPESFWAAVREATPNIPDRFSIHHCLTANLPSAVAGN
jgi:hypothetical protein